MSNQPPTSSWIETAPTWVIGLIVLGAVVVAAAGWFVGIWITGVAGIPAPWAWLAILILAFFSGAMFVAIVGAIGEVIIKERQRNRE